LVAGIHAIGSFGIGISRVGLLESDPPKAFLTEEQGKSRFPTSEAWKRDLAMMCRRRAQFASTNLRLLDNTART
jgi:hypothetical protein